ncbi:alpha/beta hydrolase [Metabacillus halosaccharovorans]|uniref:alpha/beta hydrolase n=1 Tax=Metabacillus halosaccharovorans TaxID=930124 RepID=UPI0009953B0A|nr:alpha/beta hydrolase [Metabacillus halosaccharovorans]
MLQSSEITNDEVEIIHDLVYSVQNEKELLADLYIPKNSQSPLPVIIWLHGGGWRFGDRKLGPDFTTYFASRGFAMVSIEYRLSEEVIFPAPIHDVKTAIRWVKTIAETYGLDSNRIGLWGSSAGGHLAALATTSGTEEFIENNPEYPGISSDVQAVAIGYGPVDFLKMDEQNEKNGIIEEDPESAQIPTDKKATDPDSFESLFIGAPISSCPDRVKAANPITYIKPGMSLPPFLIMHGLSDTAVPAKQSEMLYQAIAAEENDVSFYLIKGLGHGFLNRTNLDDDGPKLANCHISKDGVETNNEERAHFIFWTIEQFFVRTLKKF